MVKSFNFEGSDGKLIFEIENPNWCKMILLNPSKKLFLGGDLYSIIKKKLLDVLKTTTTNSKIKLENRDIIWAISLLETYTTIFISVDFPKTLYFLYRDKDMNDFDKLALTEYEYKTLIDLLETND